MIPNMQRSSRVHYVRCPEDTGHFILMAPCALPRKTMCRGCGPQYEVSVAADWKIGYVSQEDSDRGFSYTEPGEQSEVSDEGEVRP
jgi:hypothetical protein